MMGLRISVSDIADAVEAGLKRRLEQLDLEQAVYGIDSLHEVQLHTDLENALRAEPWRFGVHREQRYPADRRKRNVSEGERCDFVLTPDNRPLLHPASPLPHATLPLFEPPDAVDLSDAFWLEVKVVSQFTIEGANRNYASELMSTVRHDVTKLSKDADILHGGVLIVMFVRDERVAEHDLGIWQDRCIERGLPIGAPARRFIPLTDRHGHGLCAIAVYPVSHL